MFEFLVNLDLIFTLVIISNLLILVSGDWSVFGGDVSHTGYSDINLLFNPMSSSLKSIELWNYTSLSPLTYGTIANDTYYTISVGLIVDAINATNGKLISSQPLGHGTYLSPPIVYNNQIIIQSIEDQNELETIDSFSMNGIPYPTWEIQVDSKPAVYPYGTTPYDGVIYFAGGKYNGEMIAVSAVDGRYLWTASIPANYGCDYWTPTVYDGRLFMNSQPGEGNSGYLAEIDNETGTVLWLTNLTSTWDGFSTYWVPSMANDIAIVNTRNSDNLHVAGLNLTSHRIEWRYLSCQKPDGFNGSFVDYTAATDGMNAYFVCGDGIKSFDLLSGNIKNVYDCDDCGGQPIITNDCVIVNSKEGIKIFNKKTRDLIEVLHLYLV